MAIIKVLYKGIEVNPKDIDIQWTDIFGDLISGTIEEYASDYAADNLLIYSSNQDF